MQKILLISFFLFSIIAKAQQVSINNPTPDPSAVLDVKSNNSGILIPRVTKTERIGIVSPAKGLLIYQTGPDSTGFYYFQNTWHYINYDSMLPPSSIILSKIYPNNSLLNNNFQYNGQINIPNATLTEFLPNAANIWNGIDSTVANYPSNGAIEIQSIWADSVFFLAGGYNGQGIGIPFYKFNPSTGKWTLANNNTIIPAGANAARVGNKWIFWGGVANPAAPYGSAFPANIFDLNTYTLTNSAAISDSARRFLTATTVGNSIYYWGGLNIIGPSYYYKTGFKYDAVNNTWAPMSVVNAPTARMYAGAVAVGTNIIIWGGVSPGALSTGSIYRTASNTWTTMSATNAPVTGCAEPAIATFNNLVYIISGNETKRFDPVANSWTTLSPPPYTFSGQKFTYDGNGKIYVWGGARYYSPGSPTTSGYVYDIVSDTYTTIPTAQAPSARAGQTICFGNAAFMLWGGSASTGFAPTTAECLKSGGVFYLNAQNVFVTQPLPSLYMYEKK